ncbi:hypothetical protein [Sulfurovum sp. NBC37-1]|uniref:hypothetical protein n=1 Tax=Sulfurovum sp. (strain NBC37-1) TaxID=387093 RepID=UPI00015879E1|nr:hypothetical protein [Sulfurovum sp. NBC37-1]BAF72393.1 hypothetical protein SUN_1442 [Sulfurovum sp. NBC37-1]
MYELTGINEKLITSFYKTMDKTYQKDNWYTIILVAIQKGLQTVVPQVSITFLEPYLKERLKPFVEYKKLGIIIRDFIDENEAIEAYNNTCNKKTINEDEIVLIDVIYDLLKYDQVIIIADKKYLASATQLLYWRDKYHNALATLNALYKNKPDEMNYTTSTNTLKAPKDKINFLKPSLKLAIANPNKESKKEEIQFELLGYYGREHHMIARSIHYFSEIKKLDSDNEIVDAIAKLKPYVDSDRTIEPSDIYISWYAHCISIYRKLSKNKISTRKALEVAKHYSDILFPHMKGKKVVSEYTAKKPIRECAIFDGLRLLDFSDKRNKIIRSKEEIEDTELYLKEIIKVCNRFN